MSNIVPFSYGERQVRVIQDEAGNPWWVAKDVCDVLGLSNPTEAINPFRKEYKAFCDIGRFVGLDTNQARLSANKAMRRIYGTDILETLGATKFIAEDQQREYCPRDIGVILTERYGEHFSAQRVNKCLVSMGFQSRNPMKEWIPTPEGKPYSVLKDAPKQHDPNGTPVKQLFWKAEVIDIISARRSAIKSITDDEEGGDQ